MAWQIGGMLGQESRAGYDASGWLWELRDGETARRVLVEVSGPAHEIREAGGALPDDTLEAIRTEGRSVIEELLKLDDPPEVIECGTMGCHPAEASPGSG
jgi:hypothetical protein